MLKLKNMNSAIEGREYPQEVKYQCVVNYLATGNLRVAAQSVNVSYFTVRHWRGQSWWKEFEFEIANSKRANTNNKLSRLVDKSLELIEDQLEKGELVLNQKTGELIRKPVQIRDLNAVLANIMARQEAFEKQKKDETHLQQKETMQDLLKQLAGEFAKFNGSKKPQVIDVEDAQIKEDTDALHEERETGLQEGVPEVPLETGTDSESKHTEPGTWGIGEGGISPQGGW